MICSAHRRPTGAVLLFGIVLAIGCARGGDEPPGDGMDAGQRDAGTRDGGRRDTGPPTGCDELGFASTCQAATELDPIMPGGRYESELNLIRRGSAQWIRVSFPPAPPETPDGGVPSMAGTGQPRVHFLQNTDDVYRIEVRTACVGVASCGEGGPDGMATSLTEWSFGDDPSLSAEGQGQFSTRETPWPETVYVRVYPRTDPECRRYQLEITR